MFHILSEQMNSLLRPLYVTCKEGGEGTVGVEKLHIAIENNKLHFERVTLYLMVFLFFILYRRDAVNGIFWSLDTKFFFKKIHSIHTACLSCKEQSYNMMWLANKSDKYWGWHQGEPTSHQHPVMWKYRSHRFITYENIPTLHMLLHNPSIFNHKNIFMKF